LGETLPGRGLWVSAERAALEKACERGLFARAARRPIAVAPDLIDEVEGQLTARALDLLGLARRAGGLVTGFDQVRRTLAAGRAAVLIEASDGARHGRARLGALARDIPVIAHFDGAALSRSVGRDNVVHAALAPGRLADRFVQESARLGRVRREPGERGMAG
jgi:ribosomal protein L7Ae-like RNA K-turn-binding protein